MSSTQAANNPIKNSLDKALKTATQSRLEKTLRSLCNNPAILPHIEAALLTPSAVASSNGNERPRYATCKRCFVEFQPSLAYHKACDWHPGECEVDWDNDFWADHDEDCHGPLDTDDNRVEYPEGLYGIVVTDGETLKVESRTS